MYNLTIADAHTFFVGDGQWLVHNTDSNCPVGLTQSEWNELQDALNNFVDEVDLPQGKLFIQGSRVPGSSKVPRGFDHPDGPSDIDIMLRVDRVDDEIFNQHADRIKSMTRGYYPRQVREEIAKGKMSGFTLSNIYKPDHNRYWDPFHRAIGAQSPFGQYNIDFSVISTSSSFNIGPFLPIRGKNR